MKAKKFDLGFTLIELMIVIAVIGLLASMILVGVRRVQSLGRDARRIADLQQVRNGLELYFNRNQTYPQFSGAGQWASMSSALTGAGLGITSVPRDPLNRSPYLYEYSSASPWTGYVLRATLENTDNPALRDDADGTQYTLDCNDTAGYYCVVS